jgi:uncharacterized protein YaeQ
MLLLEVSGMRTATKAASNVADLDDGNWLSELLSDIQAEIARQPSPSAVKRIRTRLLAKLDRPARAAA